MYGFAKLNGSQFTILDSELDKPMGEVSGFWLTWYYFGYSTAYGTLIALGQIVGGILLTFRRTALLGALVLLPIVANIILINIFYGVGAGVVVIALLLLWGLVGVIAPHGRRLREVVLLRHREPGSVWMRALAWTARLAMLAFAFGFTWYMANYNNRAPTAIDGAWHAVHAAGGLAVIDRVFFERNRAHMVVLRDTSGRYMEHHFEVDSTAGLRIWAQWLSPDSLIMRGMLRGDSVLVIRSVQDRADSLVLQRTR